MERWNNRVAIVTGASSGIGKAIAIALLKSGMVVVGIARREDLLKDKTNEILTTKSKSIHSFVMFIIIIIKYRILF
ncbi:farnesol dehydrogenase-like [Aphis craccivora]|uniref:Farnesol dehydrogenase-like n=1 Tax=Aphis craccivora TaxID=307492 RepID=A0A6G0W1X5_APHCR|nr:farnesol dehydrogenase-like [Aphis craccivora]